MDEQHSPITISYAQAVRRARTMRDRAPASAMVLRAGSDRCQDWGALGWLAGYSISSSPLAIWLCLRGGGGRLAAGTTAMILRQYHWIKHTLF